MSQYILRDLPVDLWNHAKDRAQREGWPLRALFLQLLDDYGRGRITLSRKPPAPLPGWPKSRLVGPGNTVLAAHQDPIGTPPSASTEPQPPTRHPGFAEVVLIDGRVLTLGPATHVDENDQWVVVYGETQPILGRFRRQDVRWWFLQ